MPKQLLWKISHLLEAFAPPQNQQPITDSSSIDLQAYTVYYPIVLGKNTFPPSGEEMYAVWNSEQFSLIYWDLKPCARDSPRH